MAGTRQFTIGTEVSCSDGVVGKLSRVIVDPVAETVTYLVVGPALEPERARLVQIDLVGGAGHEIRLHCTKAEFENLDPAEETQVIPASADYGGYGPAEIAFLPYYGLGAGLVVPGVAPGGGELVPQVITTDSVPLGDVEVRRGEPVRATDGGIGHVQGLVIDRDSRHVTHVLLQEGHLWGRKEVAIPISAVASTSDGIQLKIAKQDVQDLPPVDAEPPEKKSLKPSSERTVGCCRQVSRDALAR
jgi:sporulation protein YlmC with PRC-barrel domain